MKRWRAKGVLIVLIFSVLWLLGVGLSIWRYGQQDLAKPADCIIVLGAAVDGSQPSPVFRERLRHGIALQQEGVAAKILLTGGMGEGQTFSEAEVGERFALSSGIAQQDLLKETKSRTTHANLAEAQKVMKAHRLRTAIIVSDPLHLKRASMMAKDLGMEVVASPTPSTRYRSWRTRSGFLLREVFFVHYYWFFRG